MIEFTFKLEDGFAFGKEKADYFLLKAPKLGQKALVAKLQQSVMRAITSYQSNVKVNSEAQEATESELTADTLLMIIQGANVDNQNFYFEFCESFRLLLLADGICLINGVQKPGSAWLDRMSNFDFDVCMGEYITNFLLPSVLSKKLKTT